MNLTYTDTAGPLALCLLLSLFVSSCHSLSPKHSKSGNTKFPNQNYLSSETHPGVSSSSLNLWRTGDLTGLCESNNELFNDKPVISDFIAFEDFGSYDSGNRQLSLLGESRLDKVLARIQQYDDIAGIELYDNLNRSAANPEPDDLDKSRIDILAAYLKSHLQGPISFHIANKQETRAIQSRSSMVEMVSADKIIIRVLAYSVRRDSSSISLCKMGKWETNARSSTMHQSIASYKPTPDGSNVFSGPIALSMGDRVRLRVPEDTDIEGIYEIDADGNLDVPYIGLVRARGLRATDLERKIAEKLVAEAFIRKSFAMVDVSVLQLSSADVFVSGAVFNPGRKSINGLNTELKVFKQTQNAGDAARERYLSNALVSAGGVRPDADISNVVVRRRGETLVINMEGIISGSPINDVSLISGDEVFVPTTGRFREELAQVSQITPQGIRLFVSNLATPRNPSQVESEATKLPYGTRLLHVLLSANCVGGTQLTNSAKKALLITVNPVTQVTEAIERDIQEIVNHPDVDYINPFLMPNDGIACYDSNITNYRDFARTFTDLITPFSLLKLLIGN